MEDVKKLLTEIKERVFSGEDLSKLLTMTEDERQEFILQQTERLLADRNRKELIGLLSTLLVDQDTKKFIKNNPLLVDGSLAFNEDIEGFTEVEKSYARFATHLAFFVSCMYFNNFQFFNPVMYLGDGFDAIYAVEDKYREQMAFADENFSIRNKKLVDWIQVSAYRRVVACIVDLLIWQAGIEAEYKNSVEQDFYYRLSTFMYFDLNNIEDCNEHVSAGLKILEDGEKHKQHAIEIGLDREGGSIVDALACDFQHDYPENLVSCAKNLQKLADSMMPTDIASMDEKKGKDWALTVFSAAENMFHQYDYDIDSEEHSLSMDYLLDWLFFKYLAKMYDEEF